MTARFAQKDGRTLNVRKAAQPEPKLKAIYDALGLNPLPGDEKNGRLSLLSGQIAHVATLRRIV